MERQTMFKFLFVLVVGVLILGVTIYSFLGDKDTEDYDDVFESEIHQEENDFMDEKLLEELKKELEQEKIDSDENILDEDIDRVETDSNQKDVFDGGEEYETVLDEFDYEEKYNKIFGEDVVEGTLKQTNKLITMYLNKEEDWEIWSDFVTPDFLKELQQLIPNEKDKGANKINSLEVFPTEQINKDEIIIGCIAQYDEKIELYNVVFVEDEGEFQASKIVEMWSR